MAWKITHDLLSEELGDESKAGKGVDLAKLKATPQGERITARLLDDDLEHYYTITATPDAYDDDEARGSLYHAYEWAMRDSGVTHCCIRIETAVKLGIKPEIAEKIAFQSGPHKGWCTLFS